MKKVQVGLIGYGLSGKVFHAPVIQSVEGLELKTVVSSSPQKVHADYPSMEVVGSVEELCRDDQIDLVVVATPNTTHYPFAKQALLAGKHVVVEKPFVNSVAEGEELIELAESRKRLLSVYHNRRWDNDFLTLKQILHAGMLGEVHTYVSHYDRYRPGVRDRWREQTLPGSGVLYDLGSHLIDQALHLFGCPRTVWGDVFPQRPGARVDDYFHLVLGYDSGLRVHLNAGSIVKQTGPRFQVHGTKGSFFKYGLDPQEEALRQGKKPGSPGWGEDEERHYADVTVEAGKLTVRGKVETIPGAYQAYYEGIYHAIVEAQPVPVPAAEALHTIRVIEMAVKSSREGRVLRWE
ncbi:MAG: oxidoreductase [Brevibacillus sp.]|nr:oxidoreductase [Brevibacillus sp.]